jgi:hypothetical protein
MREALQKGLAFPFVSRVTICKVANACSAAMSALTQKQESAMKKALPTVQVITLQDANHYVFVCSLVVIEEYLHFRLCPHSNRLLRS